MKKSIPIFFILLTLNLNPSYSISCNKYTFKSNYVTNNNETIYTTFKRCMDLPVLNSFLHWTYERRKSTVNVAFRHEGVGPYDSKWVAWGLNPSGKGMVGAKALVAYQSPNNGSMIAYTSPITSYNTDLANAELSFKVTNLSAASSHDEIIIFATLEVPKNVTMLNQVWQDGPLSSDGVPQAHQPFGDNVRSVASLNLVSGVAVTTRSRKKTLLKYTHGFLNGISWGILMPIGALSARYVKFLPKGDPAWFYLHMGCQTIAYGLGVAGWATGLKLGSMPHKHNHFLHRNLGIALFCLGTLQMFAFVIRPAKDHKYRPWWNIYHHLVGYSIIIIGIINILEGFSIIKGPVEVWKKTYFGIVVALAFIAVLMEAVKWYIVYQRRKSLLERNIHHGNA